MTRISTLQACSQDFLGGAIQQGDGPNEARGATSRGKIGLSQTILTIWIFFNFSNLHLIPLAFSILIFYNHYSLLQFLRMEDVYVTK